MGYEIRFPTPPEKVDPVNDNLDVLVRRDDGRTYTFVVATPANLQAMMAAEDTGFLTPGLPFLVAEALTEDVIARLIGAVMADEALARLYGCDM